MLATRFHTTGPIALKPRSGRFYGRWPHPSEAPLPESAPHACQSTRSMRCRRELFFTSERVSDRTGGPLPELLPGTSRIRSHGFWMRAIVSQKKTALRLEIADGRPENPTLLVVILCFKFREYPIPLLIVLALPASTASATHIRPKWRQRSVCGGYAAKHVRIHSISAHSYHPSPNSRRQCQQRYLPFTGREIALWNTRQ